jgi:peroxiredoxin
MVLLESKMTPLGASAPEFSLLGVDDKVHTLAEYADAKVLVVVFMCNHCPYVQKIWPDLIGLTSDFAKEVQFVGVNANANPDYEEDSFENMKKYALKMGHDFPYLYDETQEVSKAYGAVCTPDFFVYDSGRRLVYRGHFDGLASAIRAMLDQKTPQIQQKPSMGCSIKWVL